MNFFLDACSIINLVNGDAFEVILKLQKHRFFLGPQTFKECKDLNLIIEIAISNNGLTLLEDNNVSSTLFIELLNRYELGDGETECLTFSRLNGFAMCTDDRKARDAGVRELGGTERVTGSIGLLKQSVNQDLITPQEGFIAYKKMKGAGGFLPEIDQKFFVTPHGSA